MKTTFETIREIIVDHLGVDADRVTPEASLIDDLGADSLDAVELVMAIEEEFDVYVDDPVVENVKTVADAVSAVDSAKAAAA